MANTKQTMVPYDVLIVGGGPVGLTLAVALEMFLPGLKAGLLDRRAVEVPKDARAFAIAAGVRRVFEALGVWEDMAGAANPVREMRITDSGTGDIARPLFLKFSGEVAPGEPFAHMVPNASCMQALIGKAGGVEIIEPGAVKGFNAGPGAGKVTLEDGREISARLVIAADGARSMLRGLAGIKVFEHDYGQAGLVTTIAHAVPHNDVAYEHFRPAGPFASLPLTGDRSSLVWTERAQDVAKFTAMDRESLAQTIESVMGSSLGKVEVLENVQGFPLVLRIARKFTAPRLALVGDAAHVIHPIAGQGLNLGLKDVAALAEVIVDAARLGEDIGAGDVLERYARARRADIVLMAIATDGLNRLFSNDIAPVRALRDFGLSLVDRAGPVKEALIAQAAGARGAKLLKGVGL